MRRHGGREGMRRPRAGFASLPPGGPGQPSVPTYEGLPIGGLDAARTKAGESLPDRGPGSGPVRVRKLRPLGQKSRDGAPRGARVPRTRGAARRKTGAPLGAPSPRLSAGREKGKTAYPAPPRIRAAKLGCLKIESDAFGRRTTLGVMPGLDPGIHDETPRIEGLRKFADAALPHGLPG
jgi:hypothetical protein